MDLQPLRFGHIELSSEAEALRTEVRDFLTRHAGLVGSVKDGWSPEFSRALAGRGWIGMTWPSEYGGAARSALERFVLIEELFAASAPVMFHYVADRQSGPSILRFGTEEQKRFFLPRIARAEISFCIGMSEPGSGSDLAAARTTAKKVDGGYVINGTKLWTSHAHHADWMILFCKLADRGEDKGRHAGAAQFIVDMRSSGIEIRPVINLLGEHDFNELFLTDLWVPDSALLGREGDGWRQVTGELTFERSAPDRFLHQFGLFRKLVDKVGPDPTEAACEAIGSAAARLTGLRNMSLAIANMLAEGADPSLEAAIVKDLGSRFEQDIPNLARLLVRLEPEYAADDAFSRALASATMNAPRFSIQGGTREILRGVIARGLGLR